MSMLATILVIFVAIQHAGFMILEMFFWTKPLGLKIFRQSKERAEVSRVLAANQGLYNGFLAAGLIYALAYPDRAVSYNLINLFLLFVLTAGLYGGWSVSRRIWIVQALPALATLILLFVFRSAFFAA